MTNGRVLVTGGAGYIGSTLARNLLNSGYEVKVFEKFLFGLDSIKAIINHPNIDIAIGDIREEEDIKTAIEDVDSVIHLAAIVGDPACAVKGSVAVETNYIAALKLARACRDKGIEKFVFSSSCSVYGASESEILTEESELNAISLYAETKIDAENGILALMDDRFSPVILRLGTIYGLSPRMRFDLVINYLTAKILAEGKGMIFGGGQWRPFVHVADVASGFQTALEAPIEKTKGQIFNVGSTEENYQMNDIGKLLEELLPEANLEYVEKVRDKRSYHVSFDKIKDTLGFETKKTVRDGILEIRDAINSGKLGDYKSRKYYNYNPE